MGYFEYIEIFLYFFRIKTSCINFAKNWGFWVKNKPWEVHLHLYRLCENSREIYLTQKVCKYIARENEDGNIKISVSCKLWGTKTYLVLGDIYLHSKMLVCELRVLPILSPNSKDFSISKEGKGWQLQRSNVYKQKKSFLFLIYDIDLAFYLYGIFRAFSLQCFSDKNWCVSSHRVIIWFFFLVNSNNLLKIPVSYIYLKII